MAIESSRLPAIAAVAIKAQPIAPGAMPANEDADEADATEATEREPKEGPDAEGVDLLLKWVDDPNIARYIDQSTLDEIGTLVVREFNIDEESRHEWKEQAEQALDFVMQKQEPKEYPWPGSSNILFPLMTSAAFQFSARAYPALIPDRNVVKGVVIGDDDGQLATQTGENTGAPVMTPDSQPVYISQPGEKQDRADRVGQHMSWQVLEEMPEWEPETDVLLVQLAVAGGQVRKTYRDDVAGRNCSRRVDIFNIVWNDKAPSFEAAPRHTEIMEIYPSTIEEYERDDEYFLPIVYGYETNVDGVDPSDSEAPHRFLEQHRRYDLDGDGYAEPLAITVHEATQKVVRIVARYDEDGIKLNKAGDVRKIEPIDSYTLYPFLPNPRGGSTPVGFSHLLRPINEAINTTINQMFDAEHLKIAGGGFIGTSLSVPAGPTRFQIGEYKPVNNKGQSIRDSVYALEFPGASPTLFQMLGFLVQAGKEISSIQDVLTGDAAHANTPPTTMLALIEQGLTLYTAIFKRVWRSMASEFEKLYRLNRKYIAEPQNFSVGDLQCQIEPDDYRLGGGVVPAADPKMVTNMQRLSRAMIGMQFKDDPYVDQVEIRRRLFEAASMENISKILLEQPANADAMAAQAQSQMALEQAELGEKRSTETRNMAQAMLFVAQARSTAAGPELEWLEKQLTIMRLHIEALNTTVKAADVDVKMHGHTVRMHEVQQKARETAHEQPIVPFANDPGLAPQGGGLPVMEAPPGDGGLPPVPPGPPTGNAG